MAPPKNLVIESETFGKHVSWLMEELGEDFEPVAIAMGQALIALKDYRWDGTLAIERKGGSGRVFRFAFHPEYEIIMEIANNWSESQPVTVVEFRLLTLDRRAAAG